MGFSKMSEKTLRRWVSEAFPDRVRWVEPTRGSSTGMPDAFVGLRAGWELPLELKLGKDLTLTDSFTMRVRPSQRRYHILAHERGEKTAFLVLVRGQKLVPVYSSFQKVVLVNGLVGSKENRIYCSEKNWKARVVGEFEGFTEKKAPNWADMAAKIEEIVADKNFWEFLESRPLTAAEKALGPFTSF